MAALAEIPFLDQPHPWLSWLLALLAVVIVGIAKSGFGSGLGIAAIPMLVLAFGDPAAAIGAVLPLLIAADVLSVWHHWGTWDRRNLRVLAPGTLAGLLIGLVLLWWLMGMPELGVAGRTQAQAERANDAVASVQRPMEVAIGLICLIYIAADQIKARLAPELRLRASWLGGTVTGLAAGIVSAIAHAAGPVTTIFLLGQHVSKQHFVGTSVIYYFAVNVLKVPFYVLLGLIGVQTLWAGLWLLPLVPVGTLLGLWLHRVVSERVFRAVILMIVLVSGVHLIVG